MDGKFPEGCSRVVSGSPTDYGPRSSREGPSFLWRWETWLHHLHWKLTLTFGELDNLCLSDAQAWGGFNIYVSEDSSPHGNSYLDSSVGSGVWCRSTVFRWHCLCALWWSLTKTTWWKTVMKVDFEMAASASGLARPQWLWVWWKPAWSACVRPTLDGEERQLSQPCTRVCMHTHTCARMSNRSITDFICVNV